MNNKIVTFIGFAIKSNNLIAGQTPLKRTKQKLHLVLVCNTGSDNLKNLAKNLGVKHSCSVIVTNTPLEQLSNIKDVKIVGITDENLAKAIIMNSDKADL